ncbi:MAG: hypothetical protein QNK04_32005, partial [Myxococcota bacterium]|nr:hypothetical protein [Myxococcota bacterium]
ILDAALPKMFGFQVCELVKRNESLRSTHVVLMGAVHHRDRYRRDPSELYGADAYVERHELPEALRPLFVRFGFEVPGAPASAPPAPPAAEPQPAALPQTTPIEVPAVDTVAPGDRITAELPTPGHEPASPAPVASAPPDDEPLLEIDDEPFGIEEPAAPLEAPAAPPAAAASADAAPGSDDPAVAAAERLARIIVSDVILYNAERFEEGLRSGKVVESLEAELEEGRALFEQRVPPEVRSARDFLVEELLRVARSRGMEA